MIYRWLKKSQGYDELSQELAISIIGVQKGELLKGYENGEAVFEQGIEIEFEEEPTIEQLRRFDLSLSGYQRVDGRDIENIISDNLVLEYPNPYKEGYKLSALYGLTHQQVRDYIDNRIASITSLAQAKTVIGELFKKLADIQLWLVKQNRLDE